MQKRADANRSDEWKYPRCHKNTTNADKNNLHQFTKKLSGHDDITLKRGDQTKSHEGHAISWKDACEVTKYILLETKV